MLVNWLDNASLAQLQEFWWLLVVLAGSVLLLSTMVHGGQIILQRSIWNHDEKLFFLCKLNRGWNLPFLPYLPFISLVLFSGALFLAFPRFCAVSFGGARILWFVLFFSFLYQIIVFESRKKLYKLLDDCMYENLMRLNGTLNIILLGVLLGSFFSGASFLVHDSGALEWTGPLGGFELIFSIKNISLALFFLFNAKLLGAMFFLAHGGEEKKLDLAERLRGIIVTEGKKAGAFLALFLCYFLGTEGYTVLEDGSVALVVWKNILSMNREPGLFLALFFALVLPGIAFWVSTNTKSRSGLWFAGAGTIFFGLSLLGLAGFSNSAYYPSTADIASSLTIYNSSAEYASLHLYTVLLVVFLLVAAVIIPLLPGVCESRLKQMFLGWLKSKAQVGKSWLNIPRAAMLVAVACGAGILLFPPAGLSPLQARAAALTILVIGCWATSIMPPYLPAFILFVFCTLFKIAPAPVVFSGFTSAALWLIFSGLILGVGIKSTGLGDRIARKVASLLIGREYEAIIGGVTAFGVLLAFIMPSAMGRIVLLIPIALALADRFGFEPGSNGRKAVVLAATFGSSVPAFTVLPSNVPNMVLAGTAETIYNISPLYGEYLLLHFPFLGLVKAVIIAYLAAKLFPDQVRIQAESVGQSKPFSQGEKKLTLILLVLLTLWMTDFAHHISPAWVALAACVLMLIPKHGLVTGKQFNEKINYGSLFFVAGVLGLGALVSHTGLGSHLAKALTEILPLREGHSFLNYLSLAITSILTGVATTVPGAPAVLTPLADGMAQASGLSIKTILMSQVLGFSTVIFPYQAPPLVVGMQLSGESLVDALKLCLILALITIVVLLPINYLWWLILGWL